MEPEDDQLDEVTKVLVGSACRLHEIRAMPKVEDLMGRSVSINSGPNEIETSKKKNQLVRLMLKFAISVMMQGEPNIDLLLTDSDSYNGISSEKRKRRGHFIDCFFNETLFSSSQPQTNDTEMSTLQVKSNENKSSTRKKKQTLSLRQIAINFHLLSKRLHVITSFMQNAAGVVNWERNDKTLAILLLYTWACIHPHFFLIYPIILLIYYISGKYLTKHPVVEKPSMYVMNEEYSNHWDNGLGPRLKNTRANSVHGIFGFLWCVDDKKNKDSELRQSYGTQVLGNGRPFSATMSGDEDELDFQTVDDMLTFIEEAVANENNEPHLLLRRQLKKKSLVDDATKVNVEIEPKGGQIFYRNFIMKTLFDIQIQTTQILDHFDNIQLAVAENCEFIDEKESTLLLFKLFLIVSIGCILGSYIPWKTIFIASVWVGICMNHPKRKVLIDKIMGPTTEFDNINQNGEKGSDHDTNEAQVGLFSVDNVVINEPVFAREVQIFELQQQDIMNPNDYVPLGFTTCVFCISEDIRLQRRKPACANDIGDVIPPLKHEKDEAYSGNQINKENRGNDKFRYDNRKKKSVLYWDYISGETWRLSDTKWVNNVRSSQELYVRPCEDEGWVYDITGEFRRRRWVRRIFQHV